MMQARSLRCVLLLSLISSVIAENFPIIWVKAPYGDVNANVGDSVTFTYGGNHNVYIHPTGTCNETGSILVGAQDAQTASYNFTEADAGESITFACDYFNHCEDGQMITFNVAAPSTAPSVTPPSDPPSATPVIPPTIMPVPVTLPPTQSPPPTTLPPFTIPTLAPVPPTNPPTLAPPPTNPPTLAPPPTNPPTLAPPPTNPPTLATNAPVTPITTVSPVSFAPSITPSAMPSLSPSAMPSLSPSAMPSLIPSLMPVDIPTDPPSKAPSQMPVVETTETATGLRQTLNGMTQCNQACQDSWVAQMFTTTNSFFANSQSGVSVLGNTPTITSVEPVSGRRQMRRELQGGDSGVTINYDHTFRFVDEGSSVVDVYELASLPLENEAERQQFVTDLKASGGATFNDLDGIVVADLPGTPPPTPAPGPSPSSPSSEDDDPVLSTGAIIGIAVGGAVILLALIACLCCRKKDDGQHGGPPPDVLKVPQRGDEVSTLGGGPDRPYGDQSVATVDYDYSKAYGGGQDTSVSEAGGTYGSNTQGLLDPANAGATGASLGGFDGGNSFEDAYRGTAGNVKEEVIHVFAPPGKLGVVIDTPDDGAPIVHAVKDSSVIAEKIHVGDKLVAVDDEDVRAMTAIKVSKLISRKSANPSRKLTIVRTTVIE